MIRIGCQMGIFGGGQDASVAEDFLYLQQIDPRFDQMGGIAVATGIFTLLINRRPIESTTDISPISVNRSTSYVGCDVKVMKSIS